MIFAQGGCEVSHGDGDGTPAPSFLEFWDDLPNPDIRIPVARGTEFTIFYKAFGDIFLDSSHMVVSSNPKVLEIVNFNPAARQATGVAVGAGEADFEVRDDGIVLDRVRLGVGYVSRISLEDSGLADLYAEYPVDLYFGLLVEEVVSFDVHLLDIGNQRLRYRDLVEVSTSSEGLWADASEHQLDIFAHEFGRFDLQVSTSGWEGATIFGVDGLEDNEVVALSLAKSYDEIPMDSSCSGSVENHSLGAHASTREGVEIFGVPFDWRSSGSGDVTVYGGWGNRVDVFLEPGDSVDLEVSFCHLKNSVSLSNFQSDEPCPSCAVNPGASRGMNLMGLLPVLLGLLWPVYRRNAFQEPTVDEKRQSLMSEIRSAGEEGQ